MAGLTPEGFVPKRTAELKIELEARLVEGFGAINLNPESLFGQLVGLWTEQLADLWARSEQTYQSQYPGMATGINLDRAASINGITRLRAAPTSVVATVGGVQGTVLSVGRLVSATNGATYELAEDVTIDATQSVGARISVSTVVDNTDYSVTLGPTTYTYNSGPSATAESILTNLAELLPVEVRHALTAGVGGTWLDLEYNAQRSIAVGTRLVLEAVLVYADFENTQTGALELPIGILNSIQTPVAGWESVTNWTEGSLGREVETDQELRLRRSRSLRLTGSNTLDSIRSALAQLPGVLSFRVTANNGTATDSEGTPRQQIWAIVDGGASEDVAQVLYDRVAAGIGFRGAQLVNVVSPTNRQAFPIRFDRPTNVPFYVTVTVQSSVNTPTEAINLIRRALVDYANENLDIGDPVLYTRLFSAINPVIGEDAYVSALTIGEAPDPLGVTNIVAEPNERFVLTAERVQVFVLAP